MYCPTCGTQNDDSASQCAQCGNELHPKAPAGPPPPAEAVPNFLVPAILTTICCCQPFGIVAIVYAAQVNGHLTAGQFAQAKSSSDKAKTWTWVAFGCGLLAYLIGIGLGVLGALFGE